MDYISGIQSALDYIESNLTEPLDYAEIARKAACSEFYFQKIFAVLCGMTLGEYIRSRRLTLAGSELRSADKKVIDVALKYGYESPESFTRAFVKFHGITPSEAKKEGAALKSFSPLSVKLTLKGGNMMNYKIIEKEAFYVLEKASRHSVENAENKATIPEFWTTCRKDGTVETLLKSTNDRTYLFGICYNSAENQKEFDYSIAAICGNDTPVPAGYRKNLIPARTWAIFECVGAMPKAIQELWHSIVTEFFPASGYHPTYELDIEAYPDGDMNSPSYRSEIWVPVLKR